MYGGGYNGGGQYNGPSPSHPHVNMNQQGYPPNQNDYYPNGPPQSGYSNPTLPPNMNMNMGGNLGPPPNMSIGGNNMVPNNANYGGPMPQMSMPPPHNMGPPPSHANMNMNPAFQQQQPFNGVGGLPSGPGMPIMNMGHAPNQHQNNMPPPPMQHPNNMPMPPIQYQNNMNMNNMSMGMSMNDMSPPGSNMNAMNNMMSGPGPGPPPNTSPNMNGMNGMMRPPPMNNNVGMPPPPSGQTMTPPGGPPRGMAQQTTTASRYPVPPEIPTTYNNATLAGPPTYDVDSYPPPLQNMAPAYTGGYNLNSNNVSSSNSPQKTPPTFGQAPVIGPPPTNFNPANTGNTGGKMPPPPGSFVSNDGRTSAPNSARSGVSNTSNGSSSRIDPSQMPRHMDKNKEKVVFETRGSSRRVPPSSNSLYETVDTGYCSPRFMRSTMTSPPCNSAIARECNIPFGVVCNPFALIEGNEKPVPLAKTVDNQPIRCTRCRAYMNPNVIWTDAGQNWQCNLCEMNNSVPDYYYSSLDGNGQRLDRQHKPELAYGTVDYLVSEEYCVKPMEDPVYLFAIDISSIAVSSGATLASLKAVEDSIKNDDMITDLRVKCPNARVGIFTFNRQIQFYSLHEHACNDESRVKMHVIDAYDPFAALPLQKLAFPIVDSDSFSDEKDTAESVGEGTGLSKGLSLLLELIDRLPAIIATQQGVDSSGYMMKNGVYSAEEISGSSVGAAMNAAVKALANVGGRCFVMTPHSPSIGTPSTKKREDQNVYCTPNELYLYSELEVAVSAANNANSLNLLSSTSSNTNSNANTTNGNIAERLQSFIDIGNEACKMSVSVDVLLICDGFDYRDTACLSEICDRSGGNLFMLKGSISEEENVIRLTNQLQYSVCRFAGSDVIAKIRTSQGFRIDKHLNRKGVANFDLEIEFGGIDEDTTWTTMFVHDGSVKDDEMMHMQLAILYTDIYKRRLVRVHNLSLKASMNHTTIFRYCDLDAVTYALLSNAIQKALVDRLTKAADDLYGSARPYVRNMACDMLYSYRHYCSSHSPRGQLILPDSLKLLPLYCLGILKHPALIDNHDLKGKLPFIRGHERAYEMRKLQSASIKYVMNCIYPRIYQMLTLSDELFANVNTKQILSAAIHRNGSSASEDQKEEVKHGVPESNPASNAYYPFQQSFQPTTLPISNQYDITSGIDAYSIFSADVEIKSYAIAIKRAQAAGQLHSILCNAPRNLAISSEKLESDHVYLLDEGSTLYLYVGRVLTVSELELYFGLKTNARPSQVTLNTDEHIGMLMHAFLEVVHRSSPVQKDLVIVWADEQINANSKRFGMRLVEDSIYGVMSYADFLCKLHASITQKAR